MKRVFLNLFLAFSLALAPLHHAFAMQAAPSSSQGCADMSHHAGHGQSADVDGHADDSNDDNGHTDGLCNGCASCTHCSAALSPFTIMPVVSGAILHPERHAVLHGIVTHPDLRPPRLS